MKKITILFVGALLCLNFCANGQKLPQEITPFKIGEQLPASFWQQEHDFYTNGKLLRQNLTAYQGKLLILDFFATWCSTCINKLVKMEALQAENRANVAFLLVSAKNTGDTPEKIGALASRLKLPMLQTSLVNDSLLNKQFPHRTVPTYVWIDKKGVLQAITNSTLLTAQSVEHMLEKNTKVRQSIVPPKTSGK